MTANLALMLLECWILTWQRDDRHMHYFSIIAWHHNCAHRIYSLYKEHSWDLANENNEMKSLDSLYAVDVHC